MDSIDLSHLQSKLEAIFEQYPLGNLCDLCADAVSKVLVDDGYDVELVRIENEENPVRPGMRGQYILVRNTDGTFLTLSVNGFHVACRIPQRTERYYVDSFIYQRFGLQAIEETSYFALFQYPDSMEITQVRQVS